MAPVSFALQRGPGSQPDFTILQASQKQETMLPYSLESSKLGKQKSPDTSATSDPLLATSPPQFTHLPESTPIGSQADSNT
jgi:hypothetical protein